MSPIPPPRTLSHSQMETFAGETGCERRWYLQKIQRVPEAPAEALIFGSAIHSALEQDGRRIASGHMSLPLTYLMFEFAKALQVEMRGRDPGGLLRARILDMKLKAMAILRAYSEQVQPIYQPVVVESDFSLAIPGMDGWRFTGRIDAITEREGKRTIVDFKTATRRWGDGAEHHKDQATAYAWADLVGDSEPSAETTTRHVTFIVLPVEATDGGGYVCQPDVRATQRYPSQIEEYTEQVQRVAERISAGLMEGTEEAFTPRTGPLCGWCGVLGHCQPGQQWLSTHGRTPAVPVVTTARPVRSNING